ncbi:ParB N-terminal domain-containing protein [Kosakonia sp. WA-90]|uniref:ParB N-terminal domain-containing protein n=1 Tax=Kosakonia sp. WA-90 TaxID=3153576 RepID=UPI00325CBE0D
MDRINYSSWPRMSLSVTNLKLDKNNPRIPSYVITRTTRDILRFLFENEKVDRLAGKIVDKGFISHDPIYVIKEGDAYVVVEGNRRVSALKCLLEPDLAPTVSIRRKMNILRNKIGEDVIEKIEVYVAPSRKAVENVLFELHAEGKLQWNRQQKNKFIASIGIDGGESIADIAERFNVKPAEILDSVQEYILEKYFTEIDLPTDIEDKALKSKFNISTISRLVNAKKFRTLTGYFINENKLVTTCSQQFFNHLLRQFVIDIVRQKINSRNLNTTDQIDKYLDGVIQGIPDNDAGTPVCYYPGQGDRDIYEPVDEPKGKEKKRRDTLILKDKNYHTGSEKLDLLIQEAQGMLVDTYKNAAALLLRNILEMSVIRIFEIHGKRDQCMNGNGRVKNLSDNLGALLKRDVWFDDKAYLEDLIRFTSKDSASWNSLDSLNRYAHGEYTLPDRDMLVQVRMIIKPLLNICTAHQMAMRNSKH